MSTPVESGVVILLLYELRPFGRPRRQTVCEFRDERQTDQGCYLQDARVRLVGSQRHRGQLDRQPMSLNEFQRLREFTSMGSSPEKAMNGRDSAVA